MVSEKFYQKKGQITMKVGSTVQKDGWVACSKDYVYICTDKGRRYALFDNCHKGGVKLPKLTFYKNKPAFKFGSYLIEFIGEKANENFCKVKKDIGKWATKK